MLHSRRVSSLVRTNSPLRVPTRTATPIESLAYARERRAMATDTKTLTQRQREFLEQPFPGAATTLRADGSPQTTVVWVDIDEDGPSFNTAAGRAKPRHLERDPRLSLIVVDPQDPYRWLAISGRAELTTEGADDQIDKLAKKYLDADSYPWRKPEEQRLTVRIHPEKIDSYGLD